MGHVSNVEKGKDTISILLTTDNHVGFEENDPVRGDDGWKTFEEIVEIGQERQVDMIVHGGDLFHINKPSKKSMFHVMKILREKCMGGRACEIEMMSNPGASIANGLGMVNYEDPNLNISIPFFAISGNHDDCTGNEFLLPLDILSVSGLLNHFGKITNNEQITVQPLLFRKGETFFALYGMSHVKDERLHRAFRDGAVKFQVPSTKSKSWFNMLCIHQNHSQHSATSSIPENFLPNFLDFILWGHEHECIPHPMYNPDLKFSVLQAGSSIATSLTEGEHAKKHVYILNLKKKNYSLELIPLKTVRPFYIKNLILLESKILPGSAFRSEITDYLVNEIENGITSCLKKKSQLNDDNEKSLHSTLPLIRLKVEYSGGYQMENIRRFSNRFVGRVANVNDVILFYKKKNQKQNPKNSLINELKLNVYESFDLKKINSLDFYVKDLIYLHLDKSELMFISQKDIDTIIEKSVEHEDKSIIESYIKSELKKKVKFLINASDLKSNQDYLFSDETLKKLIKIFQDKNKNIEIVNNNDSLKHNHKRFEKQKNERLFVMDDDEKVHSEFDELNLSDFEDDL